MLQPAEGPFCRNGSGDLPHYPTLLRRFSVQLIRSQATSLSSIPPIPNSKLTLPAGGIRLCI